MHNMKVKNEEFVNCFDCVHFSVTWEPTYPKACKVFEFKTTQLPSAVVYETTGDVCMAFKKKTTAGSVRNK